MAPPRVRLVSRLRLAHCPRQRDDLDAAGAGAPQLGRAGRRGGAARVHVVHEHDPPRCPAGRCEDTPHVAPTLDETLTWRPSKTLRSTGKTPTIPIMPNLQAALDAMPKSDALCFLTTNHARPFASAAAFGNKFADWCKAAGLKPVLCDDGRTRSFRAHGLRKAAMYTLYKAGGNVAELQALGGHGSILPAGPQS